MSSLSRTEVVCVLSHVLFFSTLWNVFFATLWTVACQAPLSMGILQARILEWVANPYSRESPDPGIKPASPVSPALQVDSLSTEPSRKK